MEFSASQSNTVQRNWFLKELVLVDPNAVKAATTVFDYQTRQVFVPVDILAKMLSFITLWDVRNVMLVCKAWHACSQRADFWSRHVDAYLRKMPTLLKHLSSKEMDAFCLLFHPFIWKQASMKQKLWWLFSSGRWRLFVGEITKTEIHIRISPDQQPFELGSIIDRSSMTFKEYWYCEFKKDAEGKWTRHGIEDLTYGSGSNRIWFEKFLSVHRFSVFNNGTMTSSTIECSTVEGHHFEGECFLTEYKPHGKGKWTFADGTTLTGDNVAFDGKPHGVGQDGEAEWFAGVCLPNKRRKINS